MIIEIDNQKYYRIPDEFWLPIHFVRPRFKGNPESILLYLANACCKISACKPIDYATELNKAIRLIPGKQKDEMKTINNWRTEIAALFSFYTEDKANKITETSKMAKFLNENQDLSQFMKQVLFSFQFPGGHLKANENVTLIKNNVRFKPAKVILEVLLAGNEYLAEIGRVKDMSISAEEATYCIFNDSRVTSGKYNAKNIAIAILDNRLKKVKYYDKTDTRIFSSKGTPKSKGDVTRYAGDILDYMEIANLLTYSYGYYKINSIEHTTIETFIADTSFFLDYEPFYSKDVFTTKDITSIEPDWYKYVDSCLNENAFKTNLEDILVDGDEITVMIEDRVSELLNTEDKTKKEVGDAGEIIIFGHERQRLTLAGYRELADKVKIVDSPQYRPGYDIESFEGDGSSMLRYVEVKTTISKNPVITAGFHMSEHEWNVAQTLTDHYYVYRLMINKQGKMLYILKNPVGLFKEDMITATLHDGAEISFDKTHFKESSILVWRA